MGRRLLFVLSAVLIFGNACTTTREPPAVSTSNGTPVVSPSAAPVATLVHGDPLPSGCHGRGLSRKDTLAFVAQGRAWALPATGAGAPECLFATTDPGPFAWGPQGDRVAIGGLAVRGVAGDAPSLPTVHADASALGWGHPLGLAMVFASPTDRVPRKRFVDDGRVERLDGLPHGTYLQVIYHPSGLALAFVLERGDEQSIWLSSNEGLDPTRLVFSHGGTTFPSIAFTPDGSHLMWIAHHAAGYAQVHSMDLAKRDGFSNDWQTQAGRTASDLTLPPAGNLMALDEGADCDDRTALVVLSPAVAHPVVPDETRPTTVVGWLDRDTLLVAAGECGGPFDLYTADVLNQRAPTLAVTGATAAASRAPAPPAPSEVPHPQDEEPPPGGVG